MEGGAAAIVDQAQKVLKQGFSSGESKKYSTRVRLLRELRNSIAGNTGEMVDGLLSDLGRNEHMSRLTEIDGLITNIDYHIENLKNWMSPEDFDLPLLLSPGKAKVVKEPYGLTLIMGAWNFPFATTLHPVIQAIATGNVVCVKPSELSPNTSRVMKTILSRMDPKHVQCLEGGPEIAVALTQARWDLIVFTGSPQKGKLVAQAAAKHLTPTILELGGKNPCVVDKNVDLDMAVMRIVQTRFLNAGQVCLSPEFALVHKDVLDAFLSRAQHYIKQFYGENPKESKDLGRIINEFHTRRILNLIMGNHEGRKIVGGESDIAERYIAPTIILNPNENSEIAKEEIFGPVLLVYSYEDIQEAIDFINEREKPLALYYYGKSNGNMERLRNETSSGNFCWNESAFNYACFTIPFGGVGESGCGNYFGVEGFRSMSHLKGVLESQGYNGYPATLRYPPYTPGKIKSFQRMSLLMSSTVNKVAHKAKILAVIAATIALWRYGYLDNVVGPVQNIFSAALSYIKSIKG